MVETKSEIAGMGTGAKACLLNITNVNEKNKYAN